MTGTLELRMHAQPDVELKIGAALVKLVFATARVVATADAARVTLVAGSGTVTISGRTAILVRGTTTVIR